MISFKKIAAYRNILFCMYFLLTVLLVSQVLGAEEPSVAVEQNKKTSPNSENEERGWRDRLSDPRQWEIWHGQLSTEMLDAADRIDHFFGDERLDEENKNSRLRLGTGLRWHKNDGTSLLTDVKLRLALPHLKNRFQIVVDDSFESEEPGKAKAFSEAAKESKPDTSLRYILKQDERRQLTSEVGARLASPSQLFGRLRGRLILPFPIWELRLSQTVTWYTIDGFVETTELRFSRLLGHFLLFRSSSEVTWEKNNRGVTPGQSFNLYRELSRRRRYRLGISGTWPETPHTHEAKYTTEFAYRQLIHSRWLFIEISPGMEFPQELGFQGTPYINVKFEVIFDEEIGKKEGSRSVNR